MTSLIPADLALFFVATLLGAVVAGVAGFAFGLIASAIWLHIIPPAQSAPLIAAFAILIQGATLWKLRHAVQISRIIPFIAGGAAGIPLGAAALNWSSPNQMRAFIGVALIAFSVFSLARPTQADTLCAGRCATPPFLDLRYRLHSGGQSGSSNRQAYAGKCTYPRIPS